MPTSFGVIRVEQFPIEGTHTTQQLALGGYDDAVTTSIELVDDWQHPKFHKYNVRHESTLYLEGRYRNEAISEVVQVHRFSVYLAKEGTIALALARAPKKLWQEAFHRVAKDPARKLGFAVEQLDLGKLHSKLSAPIAGGWFGKLNIERVRTVGIFGADVAESDEWDRYEQSGTLQAVVLELVFEDKPYAVMLSHDWTILLYRDLGEMANLAFVEEIRQLVQKALS